MQWGCEQHKETNTQYIRKIIDNSSLAYTVPYMLDVFLSLFERIFNLFHS